ncbi:TasA family protein [Bacillus sp. AK031]
MKKSFYMSLVLFILFLIPAEAYGETNNPLDISTSPHKILFDLTNLKPGDTMSRELLIENKGEQEFDYVLSNKFLEGSKEFYSHLLLTVSDGKGVVYDGKLKDFSELPSRSLKISNQETLLFKVEVPYYLDNAYQGLSCDFEFKLYVEGTLGGVLPADGPKLPATATDIFQTLLIGAILLISGITLFKYQSSRKLNIQKD